jgi:hypothetical protein
MPVDLMHWGEPVNDNESINSPLQELVDIIAISQHFKLIQLRKIPDTNYEIAVVSVCDGTYGPKNSVGLKRTEILGLTYDADQEFPWDIRALRRDFPITLHQNQTPENEPKSLCLYHSSWKAVQRSWTPQNFLTRILWWLRETANETIHKSDQAIEQLFFTNGIQLVLPHDFLKKESNSETPYFIEKVEAPSTRALTFIAATRKTNERSQQWAHLTFEVPAIENNPVANLPNTLGSLHAQLEQKGSSLLQPLINAINLFKESQKQNHNNADKSENTFLIIFIPRLRHGQFERYDLLGYLLKHSVNQIGISCGTLFRSPTDKEVYQESLTKQDCDEWKALEVCPVEVKTEIDPQRARKLSGITDAQSEFKGLIAGVGSLGSALSNLWSRIGWGTWSYVDNDIIQPHNIAKHIGYSDHIGYPKSILVKNFSDCLYKNVDTTAFIADVTDNDKELMKKISECELIVDASTTVYVPRELSLRKDIPRTASVFVTPSGDSSVMLLEDRTRNVRLASLEAQYYRAILLSNDWGENHLRMPDFQRVGGTCRDISNAISYENIVMHSAILSKQLRKTVCSDSGRIDLWISENSTGEVQYRSIVVNHTHSASMGEWVVNWDDGFINEIKKLRKASLPKETGGVILGIVDTKSRQIHIVIGLSAPEDSDSSELHFYRGFVGLRATIEECQRRTADMVIYIGEWHSHPTLHSANPSSDDCILIQSLSDKMKEDGLPILMVIVSDDEFTITSVSS